VLVVDPASSDAPREVARFSRAVLSIEVRDGKIRARGDDRRAFPLKDSEAVPENCIVIEEGGARFAFPREPVVREVEVTLPGREDGR
jgi:hypothetical protein